MAFGGLISTSNKLAADEVEVETDSDLIWTVELRD
jgi:thiamine pyrophosphokinase